MKQIRFVGVDEWNRPTFKETDGNRYYCDVEHLFNYGATEPEIKAQADKLTPIFKGYTFNAEPQGDPCEVQIIWQC